MEMTLLRINRVSQTELDKQVEAAMQVEAAANQAEAVKQARAAVRQAEATGKQSIGTIEQKRRVLAWLKSFDGKFARPFETGDLSGSTLFGGTWNEYAAVVLSMLTLDTLVNIEEQLKILNNRLTKEDV